MAISTAIIRQAARTTTGTQDFTSSGFGTPKAAIFIATNATTDGTVIDHAFLGMGFTDGTRSRCISQNNQHNVTSTAHRKWNKSQVLCFSPAGSQSEDIEANFSAWITDGVRINYTAAAGAYLITCVLLAGDDLTAYVNHIGLQNTTPLTIDVTDPGFEPDIVLTMVCESVAIDDANGQSWNESGYGVVHNNGAGTITQRCIFTFESGGQSTSDVDSWLSDDNGAMSRDPIVDWSASFHTFDSSGFSIDINDDGGNTTDMPYMALKFANHSSGVITHTTPTSTGNSSDTGFGFKPQFVMMGMTWVETADTQTGGNNGGVQGLSVFNATSEFSHAYAVEDGQTTTDTQSISDNTAVRLPGGDGTTEIVASFVSFDANGFTLNYSDVEASGKLFFAWAVQEDAAAAADPLAPVLGRIRSNKNTILRM